MYVRKIGSRDFFRLLIWVSVITSIFISSMSLAEENHSEQITKFSEEIINVFSEKNSEGLNKLECLPKENDDFCEDALVHLYGKKQPSSLVKLLRKPSVKVKVFGPYTYEEKFHGKSYLIIFYDSEAIDSDKLEMLSSQQIKKRWMKSYAETVVLFLNGKIGFHRTPFYYGAHAPWADDYGKAQQLIGNLLKDV